MIRRALRADYYKDADPHGLLGPNHIGHCIDSLRMSLMCNPDLSILPWQWSDKRDQLLIKARVPHTCRSFDSIKEWAAGRAFHGFFDMKQKVPNDPLGPWVKGKDGYNPDM